jgi:predicted nucleic acid-binding protein
VAKNPDKKPEPRRAGRQIDVADAWITATAILYGSELVTHNAGDFSFLPGLTIITEA